MTESDPRKADVEARIERCDGENKPRSMAADPAIDTWSRRISCWLIARDRRASDDDVSSVLIAMPEGKMLEQIVASIASNEAVRSYST